MEHWRLMFVKHRMVHAFHIYLYVITSSHAITTIYLLLQTNSQHLFGGSLMSIHRHVLSDLWYWGHRTIWWPTESEIHFTDLSRLAISKYTQSIPFSPSPNKLFACKTIQVFKCEFEVANIVDLVDACHKKHWTLIPNIFWQVVDAQLMICYIRVCGWT